MMSTLTVAKQAVNIPVIPGDLFAAEDAPPNLMFSAQQGFPYIVDLTVSLFEVLSEEVSIPQPITSLQITTPGLTGVNFTVIDPDPLLYKIRVDGVLNSDFITPPTYSFVLDQENYSNPFPTANNVSTGAQPPENFLAVYRFDPPTILWKFETPAYLITTTPTASTTLNQYVYWGWQASIQNFKNLVLAGSI